MIFIVINTKESVSYARRRREAFQLLQFHTEFQNSWIVCGLIFPIFLTVFVKLVEAPFPELGRIPTELRVSLPRRDLEIEVSDPARDPGHPAVAGEEPAAETEPLQGGVEVPEGLLRHRRHRVSVQSQQRQGADPGERVRRDGAEQVEPEIQYLK